MEQRRTYSVKSTITIRLKLYAHLQLFSYSSNQPLYHLQRERSAFCAAAPTVWNSHGVHTRSADTFLTFNPLKGTLKPQSNGPLYSNTVIGTLAVDGHPFLLVYQLHCV